MCWRQYQGVPNSLGQCGHCRDWGLCAALLERRKGTRNDGRMGFAQAGVPAKAKTRLLK